MLGAFLAFTLCFGLAACGPAPNADTSSSAEHVHSFDDSWGMNAIGHWRTCTGCKEKLEYAKHSGGNAKCGAKNECEVCGKEYGSPVGHGYGDVKDTENGKAYVCDDCGDTQLLADLVDFVVEAEEGDAPVILQLTDPQIMSTAEAESKCYSYIRETIQATQPDLIIVTGDLTYGKFDTADGKIFTDYVNFMESFQIPWAPVFGNHDNECPKGVDWQCQVLETAQYCLFEQRDLTGNGNYSVGVLQGNNLLRVFYMLDSNGCSEASGASIKGKNGIKTSNGFAEDQISWYSKSMQALKKVDADVKISMAYHIQTTDFFTAYTKYEEFDTRLASDGKSYKNPLFLDQMETAQDGDVGFLGRPAKGAWNSTHSHNALVTLGVDSIFVGHEHCNSASVLYKGIRYQYGQKSSTYDRYNALTTAGSIVGAYDSGHSAGSVPLIGGTAFSLSKEDGSIENPYIYYCGNPFGN